MSKSPYHEGDRVVVSPSTGKSFTSVVTAVCGEGCWADRGDGHEQLYWFDQLAPAPQEVQAVG